MSLNPENKLITGIAPAFVTPFDADYNLALSVVPGLFQNAMDAGIAGAFVNGWSAEHYSLTQAERKKTAEAFVSEAGGQIPVIVHIGGTYRADAIDLSEHANKIKADAVALTPPPDHKGDIQTVFDYYRDVAHHNPDLPLYIYMRSDMKVNGLTPLRFLYEMRTADNFAGIKYTDSDLNFVRELKKLSGGKLNLLTGSDQLFLEGLKSGSDGAIGSTYTVMPGNFVAIYENFNKGDLQSAEEKQLKANRLIDALEESDVLPGIKGILETRGIPVGKVRESVIYKRNGEPSRERIDKLVRIAEENGLK